MKENNNILIIVENLQKQRLLFKYMVSKFEDNLCTYYNGMPDIRIKNKHIKIATLNSNPNDSYDLIIIERSDKMKQPLYKYLYFQVIVAIIIGILLGHFQPTLGSN